MEWRLHKRKVLQHVVTAILLMMLLPFIVLFDIFAELYHRIGFRLCNIPLINRRKYIKIDRHKLKYLNWFDKLACMYCGYANGFSKYIVEMASRTENYWCAIKHKETSNFNEPTHHKRFLKYGDEKAYRNKYH
jgi:hypothetical protein